MWMRLLDDIVCDLATVNPVTLYTAAIAAEFVIVPPNAPTDLCSGFTYDGTTWVEPNIAILPPPPLPFLPVPAAVTNYQARAVLIEAGYFAKVDATLRGADQTVAANAIALQAWDYANQFFRSQPLIAAMQAVLELTDAQVDALFQQASQVQ